MLIDKILFCNFVNFINQLAFLSYLFMNSSNHLLDFIVYSLDCSLAIGPSWIRTKLSSEMHGAKFKVLSVFYNTFSYVFYREKKKL